MFFSDQERNVCPVDMPIDDNLKALQANPLLRASCSKITTYQVILWPLWIFFIDPSFFKIVF